MQAKARHRRVKALFYDAWLRPPSERGDFLAAVCDGKPELRLEVESLLRYHQPLVADSARGYRPQAPAPRKFRRGALVAGRYRIERLIGKGGMGEVYAAEDRMLGVLVALKALRQVDHLRRRQMVGEVRLARQITHPGVCRVYDIGEHAGTPFLTMELIEGEDLAKRLQRSGPLPSDEVAALGERICEALGAAHAAGVLHRDLKPSNILVDRQRGVHLTDFGIASSREVGAASDQSSAGRIFGTPAYMAPEESVAAAGVTEKTDLYSLGLVLYELLTGAPPFDAADSDVLRELHRTAAPEQPSRRVSGVDPRLERCILALLSKDPEQRPESARAVAEALAASPDREAPAERAEIEEGERRPATLMLCGLAAPAGGELELTPGMLRFFQIRCAALVRLHGGRIVRHLDRGLLVQFGYLEAREDAPESAARAGLAILGEVRAPALARELAGRAEPVVVIDVERVVLRDRQRHSRLSGQALLDRLGALSVAGALVVSDAALAGLRGAFESEPIDGRANRAPTSPARAASRATPGAPAPSSARSHRIVGPRRRDAGRPSAARLTPLIGRSEELALLRRCWRRAKTGRGEAVLVSGEAGLGKTRLAAEFLKSLGEEARVLEARCSSLDRTSTLHPFLELLAQAFDLRDSDDGPARVAKLGRGLAPLSAGGRLLPVLAAWLATPPAATTTSEITARSPETERRAFITALAEWILAQADERPVALVCEDVHWADPTTVEALDHLVGEVQTGPVMMLVTCRPEFRPTRGGSRITPLLLQPLEDDEAQALIAAAGAALTPGMARGIVARAEGNPFFLEELVKERAEAPPASALTGESASSPPIALQGLLAARLDRLGSAKWIAQAAAVCGRRLSYRLLESLTAGDHRLATIDLAANVDRLLDAEILFQRGTRPDATLTFKHALLAEAAHESLPRRRRRTLHGAVAELLPELEPGLAAARPEVVAGHWAEASNRGRALEWWRRAGSIALGRSAYAEAISHLELAIAALGAVPPGAARVSLEAELWTSLHLAETGRAGPSSSAVARCVRRLNALCPRLEDDGELAKALYLLCRFHFGRAAKRRTLDLMRRLASVCERIDDHFLAACAQVQKQNILTLRGRLDEADRAYARGLDLLALADATPVSSLIADPLAMAETARAFGVLLRGRTHSSRRSLRAAIDAADRLDHPLSRAYPRISGAVTGLLDARFAETAALVREGVEIVAAVSPAVASLGRAYEACAAIGLGIPNAGVALAEEGLAAFDACGYRHQRPVVLLFLAEALERERGSDAALGTLDEALDHARRCVDSYLLPEIQRRRGEALARLSRHAEAEAALRAGVRASRRSGAFGLELRAVVSLARFLTTQGQQDAARRTLLAIQLPGDLDARERAETTAMLDAEIRAATRPTAPR